MLAEETSSNATNITLKLISELARIMQYIAAAPERKVKSEIAKMQLNGLKSQEEQKEAIKSLKGVYGMVNRRAMIATGKELDVIGAEMTREELAEYSAYAKREGLTFYAVEDTRKNDNEIQTFTINVFKEDFSKARGIADRVFMDRKIIAIDAEIERLENKLKSEGLTEQERIDLEALRSHREELRHDVAQQYNSQKNSDTISNVMNGTNYYECDFDASLDRYTDGQIERKKDRFICERTKPENYIECHADNYEFHGKRKIGTDYTVFKDNKVVLETNDRFFDGRQKNYWQTVKEKIRAAGDFSDDLLMFNSKSDLERYTTLFNEQQKELANFSEKHTEHHTRDYDAMIKTLEQQLDCIDAEYESGGVIEDENGEILVGKGIAVDKTTKEELVLTDNLSEEQATRIAEATVIVRQINNYNDIARLETEYSLLEAKIETLESEETPANLLASEKERLANFKLSYEKALEQEQRLVVERSQINGAQAQQAQEKEYQESLFAGLEDAEYSDSDRMMESYMERIDEIKHNAAEASNNDSKSKIPSKKRDYDLDER